MNSLNKSMISNNNIYNGSTKQNIKVLNMDKYLKRKCPIHNLNFKYICSNKECIDNMKCFLCYECQNIHPKHHKEEYHPYYEIFSSNLLDDIKQIINQEQDIINECIKENPICMHQVENIFNALEVDIITILRTYKEKFKNKILGINGSYNIHTLINNSNSGLRTFGSLISSQSVSTSTSFISSLLNTNSKPIHDYNDTNDVYNNINNLSYCINGTNIPTSRKHSLTIYDGSHSLNASSYFNTLSPGQVRNGGNNSNSRLQYGKTIQLKSELENLQNELFSKDPECVNKNQLIAYLTAYMVIHSQFAYLEKPSKLKEKIHQKLANCNTDIENLYQETIKLKQYIEEFLNKSIISKSYVLKSPNLNYDCQLDNENQDDLNHNSKITSYRSNIHNTMSQDADKLLGYFKNDTTKATFYLWGKGGNNILQELAKSLEISQNIKSLSFIFGWSLNRLSNEGLKTLATSLLKIKDLNHLSMLFHCHLITDEGLIVLFEVLTQLLKLNSINISFYNNDKHEPKSGITDKTAKIISKSLIKMSALRCIEFDFTKSIDFSFTFCLPYNPFFYIDAKQHILENNQQQIQQVNSNQYV